MNDDYNKRILEADLPADYKDGEVLQHIDLNKIEAMTRTGINENYKDIQKMQDGTVSVGNATLLMGNSLSKQEDEPLRDDDTKISSSKQVKTYVDLEIFNRLQGIEDQFYTKDQIDAQQATKVDKVDGKELSTNDFTDTLKTKLEGVETGAEANVQSDWNATEGDAFIKNKPTIPTTTNDLTNNSGFITSTDDITGNATTSTTADKTVGTLTIQRNGTNLNTFNGSSNRTVNIAVPLVEDTLASTNSLSALSAKQGRELDLLKQNKLTAGNNITITGNTISATDTQYSLPTASNSVLGGVKVGDNLTIDNDGKLSANASGVGKSEGPNKGEIFNIYSGSGKNKASGEHSHAEGVFAQAVGINAHAEGNSTSALGANSHAEGLDTFTQVNNSHICGQYGKITNADDPDTFFAVANGTFSADAGRNIGLKFQGTAGNGKLYVEGKEVATKGDIASTTNLGLVKVGDNLTIDADGTLNATGGSSGVGQSEGPNKGEIFNSYSDSNKNVASGKSSHAEGEHTTASGSYSHAEGSDTIAGGYYAHAEGCGSTIDEGIFSAHAEGSYTKANGNNSHSEGNNTSTNVDNSHIGGRYGKITKTNDPDTLFAIANGLGEGEENIGLKFQGLKGNGKLYVEGKEVGLKENIPIKTSQLTNDSSYSETIVLDGMKLAMLNQNSTPEQITEAFGGAENEQKLKEEFLNLGNNLIDVKVACPMFCVNANLLYSSSNNTCVILSFDFNDFISFESPSIKIYHISVVFPFSDAGFGAPKIFQISEEITP